MWELMDKHNRTRMQKRPYSREERFHAMEKGALKPLPQEPYQMRYYADLKVQANCHVELRHDKVTHFYSVPYMHVGKPARVIFTRSWVNIYVDNVQVASHLRNHEYGYTTVKEHLASNCRAIMERSAAYYTEKAKHISPECYEYVREIFNPHRTNNPEEIYYKLCDSIISLRRRYEYEVFDLSCRQCKENKVFTYRRFEAILKHNSLKAATDESASLNAPTPTGHVNMRGREYFDQQ